MPKPITIPKLGLTMRKAIIQKWLKNEGEVVVRDKPVALIETEKVSAEVQAPDDGVLLKVLFPKGAVVQVGAVIGYVGQPGEPIPETDIERHSVVAPATPSVETSPSAERWTTSTDVSAKRRVSPRARVLAEEKGIDLSKVVGSGPGGIVMERDVLDYIQVSFYRTAHGLKVKQIIPMSPTRKAIAENMVSSLQSMAQVTLTVDVPATQLEKIIKIENEPDGQKEQRRVTYTDLLIMIVAGLLKQHPLLNSTLEDDKIKVVEEVNVGIAVAVETGLVVPVIRGTDKKSLSAISDAVRELAEKARQGNLTLDEITGGTFTITNLGPYGIDAFTPIINPPQVAILGVGRVSSRPTVEGDNVVARPVMTLSLTFDHRVIDGHTAALFLRDLRAKIEKPPMNESG